MSETGLESGRKRYSPFTEVLVSREEGGDTERLYIGQIIGTSMLRTWTDEDGNEQHTRYVIDERVDTPQPMVLEDVLEWVESAPDELNDVLENDLETDLGKSIGFSEYYPREDDR